MSVNMIKELYNLPVDTHFDNLVSLIQKVERRKTMRNEDYFDLTLSDRSGQINAKIWRDSFVRIPVNKLQAGLVARISGRVASYAGSKHLVIESLKLLSEQEFDQSLIYRLTTDDIQQMWNRLKNFISQIEHKILRLTIDDIFESDIGQSFKTGPAALVVHHNYRGGLLEHTLEVVDMALALYKHYTDYANKDVIIAGALLHDVGKILEYTEKKGQYVTTSKGMLLGHIILGVDIFIKSWDSVLNRLSITSTAQDSNIRDHVVHVILSHHTELEFGAVVRPSTVEAAIVSQADMASSKIKQFAQEYEKLGDEAQVSQYNKYIKTHVIKI